MCGPLSVVYMTMVSSAMPSSSSRSSISPTFLSWSIIVSWYGDCQRPAWPRLSGLVCVRKCMCVVLSQQKNGLPASCWRLMKSFAAATNSSSQVSMRLLVSGPVSSIFCLPTRPQRGCSVGSSASVAQQCSTPRGPKGCLELRELLRVGVVRILGLLLGVEVIEVAEELVEAVHGRQVLVQVAEVVLAELPGGVALRLQQLGDRRVLGLQADVHARQPDLESPVRKTHCPVMKDARPAVQLCSP